MTPLDAQQPLWRRVKPSSSMEPFEFAIKHVYGPFALRAASLIKNCKLILIEIVLLNCLEIS